MAIPLVVLFIAVPLIELAVILQVGREIGVGPTILVLIADSLLGSLLMRAQGAPPGGASRRQRAADALPPARCSTAC